MKRVFVAIGIATLAVAMAAPLALADQVLNGTAGADTIVGSAGKDRINGLGGNDNLNGWAGRDQIRGGAGADVIVGGRGSDVLIGEAGNDVIRGGPGIDEIIGRYGQDRIFGGGGNDIIRADYAAPTTSTVVLAPTMWPSSISSTRSQDVRRSTFSPDPGDQSTEDQATLTRRQGRLIHSRTLSVAQSASPSLGRRPPHDSDRGRGRR